MSDAREIVDVVARKGTRVTCANQDCGKLIATFAKTLSAGAPDIGIDLLEFEEGQARDAGSTAICFTCGTPFWRATYSRLQPLPRHEIHTPDGWLMLNVGKPKQ